jgi:hypothetical protein
MPWFGLTCDEKDRFLPNVAVADDNLHDNGSIEASAEHPPDRIRNAGGGENGVTSRQADVEDGGVADHTASEGARSAAVAYWKDGSGD